MNPQATVASDMYTEEEQPVERTYVLEPDNLPSYLQPLEYLLFSLADSLKLSVEPIARPIPEKEAILVAVDHIILLHAFQPMIKHFLSTPGLELVFQTQENNVLMARKRRRFNRQFYPPKVSTVPKSSGKFQFPSQGTAQEGAPVSADAAASTDDHEEDVDESIGQEEYDNQASTTRVLRYLDTILAWHVSASAIFHETKKRLSSKTLKVSRYRYPSFKPFHYSAETLSNIF
jgi:hypothetical protein